MRKITHLSHGLLVSVVNTRTGETVVKGKLILARGASRKEAWFFLSNSPGLNGCSPLDPDRHGYRFSWRLGYKGDTAYSCWWSICLSVSLNISGAGPAAYLEARHTFYHCPKEDL